MRFTLPSGREPSAKPQLARGTLGLGPGFLLLRELGRTSPKHPFRSEFSILRERVPRARDPATARRGPPPAGKSFSLQPCGRGARAAPRSPALVPRVQDRASVSTGAALAPARGLCGLRWPGTEAPLKRGPEPRVPWRPHGPSLARAQASGSAGQLSRNRAAAPLRAEMKLHELNSNERDRR